MKKKYLLMMSVLGVFFAGQISQAKQVLADSKVKIVTTSILFMNLPKALSEVREMCLC